MSVETNMFIDTLEDVLLKGNNVNFIWPKEEHGVFKCGHPNKLLRNVWDKAKREAEAEKRPFIYDWQFQSIEMMAKMLATYPPTFLCSALIARATCLLFCENKAVQHCFLSRNSLVDVPRYHLYRRDCPESIRQVVDSRYGGHDDSKFFFQNMFHHMQIVAE